MYLNGELAKKTDEILELQERMQTLQDDSERQALEHDSRMLAQKDAAALQSHKLELDIKSYKEQLEKVNKFIAEQKEMEARLEEQAKQIEADAANHAHVISELERK